MLGADKRGEFLLESLDLRTAGEEIRMQGADYRSDIIIRDRLLAVRDHDFLANPGFAQPVLRQLGDLEVRIQMAADERANFVDREPLIIGPAGVAEAGLYWFGTIMSRVFGQGFCKIHIR